MNDIENSTKGEMYLFVVAIDQYQKEKNLNHCKQEATEFIEIFHRHTQVKSKNIYTLFDHEATKGNILNHLSKFNKLLNANDDIVIYMAGRATVKEQANLFVPFDGHSNNLFSCLSSIYVAKNILDYKSHRSLLFCDHKFSKHEFANYNESFKIDWSPKPRNNALVAKRSLYSDFISFFSKTNRYRIKEAFSFLKGANNNNIGKLVQNKNSNFYVGLDKITNSTYNDLIKLVSKRKTEELLKLLERILQNNDADLYSRVKSLSFKFNQLSKDEVKPSEKIKEKSIIDEIACEVVERIKQNGFYLIESTHPKNTSSLRKKRPTKILLTSANPRDQKFLRLDKEASLIEYELMKAKNRDSFELKKIKGLNANELEDILLNDPPDFLHFCGHGTTDGILFLNEVDTSTIAENKPLASLLGFFSNKPKCVFLNSCHSASQSEEICKHIRRVIGMTKRVPDHIAIAFAVAFYKAIGSGRTIDKAFDFAKISVDFRGLGGSDIPVLLPEKRSKKSTD